MTEAIKKKSKAHVQYLSSIDGTPFVGTTTALGMKSKPYLYNWYNKLGLDGVVGHEYLRKLAEIGSLGHSFIEHDVKCIEIDLSDYTPAQVEIGRSILNKWLEWKSKNNFELIGSEMQLVSEEYKYGGTIDLYGKVNGKFSIIDIKSSDKIYDEHLTQTVAYRQLAIENGKQVDECRILKFSRNPKDTYEEKVVGDWKPHWRVFKACVELYYASKSLENSGS